MYHGEDKENSTELRGGKKKGAAGAGRAAVAVR
jgi:hypothetical protein